jgi:hypothetical protein
MKEKLQQLPKGLIRLCYRTKDYFNDRTGVIIDFGDEDIIFQFDEGLQRYIRYEDIEMWDVL